MYMLSMELFDTYFSITPNDTRGDDSDYEH
jgi:hypothetical protein